MVTHQPPSRFLWVIETDLHLEWPLFSQIYVIPDDEFYFRLELLDKTVNSHLLMPGRDPLFFWNEAHPLERREWDLRAEREKATSTYMGDCYWSIFCRLSWLLKDDMPIASLDHWIDLLGHHKRVRGLFR